MQRAIGSWRATVVLLLGVLSGQLLQPRGRSAQGNVAPAAAPTGVVRTSSYVEITSSSVNTDVPTGLVAGQLWTDFYIASAYTSFGQCTFKNGGATILVATVCAPNYDAHAQFATPVVLNGPLTVSCPGANAKIFVSGYR
jgi:hypothetical protein